MGYQLPTLTELIQRCAGSINANLKGSDARMYPNNAAVTAKVMGGTIWENFSFLQYISQQQFAHTATDAEWIQKHAAEFGLAQLPASYAVGKVVLEGDIGVVVPAGIFLERADGIQYEVTNSGTVNGSGEVTLPVRCLTEGKTGNCLPDVKLTLTVPRDQINPEGLVHDDGVGAGADAESMESLRQRILFRKRNPPHGGSRSDYVIWTREVPGVTRVYVDPVTAINGRDTIGLWPLMDDTYPNGIPQAADITAIEDYLAQFVPAGAVVEVAAPTPVTVPVTIGNLATDTQAVRDAITLELRAMFRRECAVSTLTEPFKLWRSLITEAIANATGEHHHSISAPATDADYTEGQIPVLGAVTFT